MIMCISNYDRMIIYTVSNICYDGLECQNSGTCNVDTANGNSCICPSGIGGALCDENPCDGQCTNGDCIPMNPDFECSMCDDGFTLNTDNSSCINIYECSDTSICDTNAVCTDMTPGFRCDCNGILVGDGFPGNCNAPS